MALPSWLRQLLLCTLVLTLPLQSLAATAMALCAWTASAASDATAMADPLPDALPDALTDDSAGCHEAAASSSTADHHCGVCALCALVGTLPAAPPAVPAVKDNLPPAPAPAAKVAAVAGDRLDRPPRARG